jgi:hypothetical protein
MAYHGAVRKWMAFFISFNHKMKARLFYRNEGQIHPGKANLYFIACPALGLL